MRYANATTADQHQRTTSLPIDDSHRDQGEEEVDGACDDNIEKDLIGAKPRCAKNLFRVVEENIDAAPPLQYGKHNPDDQYHPYAGLQ